MQLPAVQARSVENNRAGRWFGRFFVPDTIRAGPRFNRCVALERHWVTAGFAFGGCDTCRDFGVVEIVFFLAVRTGDFHFRRKVQGSELNC